MEINKKSLTEIISVLVLAAGLVLVAYQIDQANRIADAEIRAEATSRWRAVDGTRQSENFALVLAKSYEDPEALTLAEMIELDAYYMGVIDQMSSAFRASTMGYRDGSIDGYLAQGALTYFGNTFAKAWWQQYKTMLVGDDLGFVTGFDEAVEAVSETGSVEMYQAIRDDLAPKSRHP